MQNPGVSRPREKDRMGRISGRGALDRKDQSFNCQKPSMPSCKTGVRYLFPIDTTVCFCPNSYSPQGDGLESCLNARAVQGALQTYFASHNVVSTYRQLEPALAHGGCCGAQSMVLIALQQRQHQRRRHPRVRSLPGTHRHKVMCRRFITGISRTVLIQGFQTAAKPLADKPK